MFDVIIPAYNAGKSIEQAVASALSAGASKVFVVDDGSSDQTADIAASAGAIVVRQPNSGASRARQRGAEVAESDLLIFLDADDTLVPAGVARSLELIDRTPSAVAAGGGVSGLLPNGDTIRLKRTYSGEFGATELIVTGFGPWPPGAAVIRRQAYLDSLSLPIRKLSTRYAEDYEMFIRMSSLGNLISHTEPALIYSMHEGKSSRDSLAPILDKEAIRAYYAKHYDINYEAMSTENLISASMFRAARKSLANRAYLNAIILGLKGIAVDPNRALRRTISTLWQTYAKKS